jgi:hypothetical protein
MNSLQPSLSGPQELDRSPNDLDGLLRSFFRAQMPEPWPVPKPPATSTVRKGGAAAARRSLVRSRFALAACLLVLLVGQSFVSSMLSDSMHAAADGRPGKTEARRHGPVKPRESKPTFPVKKAEATGQSGGEGILISGRR